MLTTSTAPTSHTTRRQNSLSFGLQGLALSTTYEVCMYVVLDVHTVQVWSMRLGQSITNFLVRSLFWQIARP